MHLGARQATNITQLIDMGIGKKLAMTTTHP